MKSNRTAVKALCSGCGKCSERGLGPCADGIAAAKKKMETRGRGGRRRVIRADCRGDLGRTAVGAWGGQPRGHLSGDGAVPTGVVLRLRGPGGRWSERCFWRLWGLGADCLRGLCRTAAGSWGGFGTDDVYSLPGSCVVCRGRGRAGVGVDGVCCVGVGGGVLWLMGSCRYCGVSDGFDGCGGLQKGLCRRGGDFFRLVHRTDSVPAVRAQKKGTAYTCRYRGPSG